MRMKIWISSITAILLFLISACSAVVTKSVAAVVPKEPVVVHFVCKSEDIVMNIAGIGMRNKEGLEKANRMLVERYQSGDCAQLPGGVRAPVKALIELGVDFEGDPMAVVQLDAPDDDEDPYWSIIVLPGKGA